jgi:hypothetical protein
MGNVAHMGYIGKFKCAVLLIGKSEITWRWCRCDVNVKIRT